MSFGECPACGRTFVGGQGDPMIPTHDYPPPCRQVCPGSGMPPRRNGVPICDRVALLVVRALYGHGLSAQMQRRDREWEIVAMGKAHGQTYAMGHRISDRQAEHASDPALLALDIVEGILRELRREMTEGEWKHATIRSSKSDTK